MASGDRSRSRAPRRAALGGEATLRDAFETDVRPLVAEARRRMGGALEPVAAFRASGHRAEKANERPSANASAGVFS